MADKLDGTQRHRAVYSSEYFCLQQKLVAMHTMDIWAIWNWEYNFPYLGG